MYYYRIGYYKRNSEGIYEQLPIMGEVTTEREVAEKWFANSLRQYKERPWCYNVGEVDERDFDYACYVKQAHVICDEAGHLEGEYLIEIQCYTHNPNL